MVLAVDMTLPAYIVMTAVHVRGREETARWPRLRGQRAVLGPQMPGAPVSPGTGTIGSPVTGQPFSQISGRICSQGSPSS